MDHQAFDGLTRSLTASLTGSTTRRGITRLLGGLALGGPLVLLGLSEAGATCKKKCGPCKRCKKGKCKPKPSGTACAGGTCQGGVCIEAASPAPSAPLPPLPCTTAATCPAPPTSQLCAQATCIGGVCGVGPKAAGTVCRPVAGECDVAAEVCEGTGLNCPANQFKPANTPCTSDANSCTFDICSGSSSTCTHPPVSDGTSCGTEQSCCGGTCCIAGDGCSTRRTCCRGLNKPCSSNAQCCSNNCSGICLQ
jgi:hypothetical protein